MIYNLVAPNGRGIVTEYKECLPSKKELDELINKGWTLYIDGKRVSKRAKKRGME